MKGHVQFFSKCGRIIVFLVKKKTIIKLFNTGKKKWLSIKKLPSPSPPPPEKKETQKNDHTCCIITWATGPDSTEVGMLDNFFAPI